MRTLVIILALALSNCAPVDAERVQVNENDTDLRIKRIEKRPDQFLDMIENDRAQVRASDACFERCRKYYQDKNKIMECDEKCLDLPLPPTRC